MESQPLQKPRVSIGLPVYNGEQYLRLALDSLLAQTYPYFEIIISDNASTDSTREICLEYASRDSRIKYHRNEHNMGVVWNFNHVFQLSSTEYFIWFSDDDVLEKTYIERCVQILDKDPSVVAAFSNIGEIDSLGKLVGTRQRSVVMDSKSPTDRFRSVISLNHRCEPSYGVMRSQILRKTPLYGVFADYDRVFLAELGLYGRFIEIPELLFFERDHPKRSTNICSSRFQMTIWVDPNRSCTIVCPHLKQFTEFLAAIRRAPGGWIQKARCYFEMLRWAGVNRSRILGDLRFAGREALLWLGTRFWVVAPSSIAAMARLNIQRPRIRGKWFAPEEAEMVRILVSQIVPSDRTGPGAIDADVVERIESEVASSNRSQYLYTRGLISLNQWAQRERNCNFISLTHDEQLHLLQYIDRVRQGWAQNGSLFKKALRKIGILYCKWKDLYAAVEFFPTLVRDVVRLFYTSETAWDWLGYDGPPMPLGYPDLWETRDELRTSPTVRAARSE